MESFGFFYDDDDDDVGGGATRSDKPLPLVPQRSRRKVGWFAHVHARAPAAAARASCVSRDEKNGSGRNQARFNKRKRGSVL